MRCSTRYLVLVGVQEPFLVGVVSQRGQQAPVLFVSCSSAVSGNSAKPAAPLPVDAFVHMHVPPVVDNLSCGLRHEVLFLHASSSRPFVSATLLSSAEFWLTQGVVVRATRTQHPCGLYCGGRIQDRLIHILASCFLALSFLQDTLGLPQAGQSDMGSTPCC